MSFDKIIADLLESTSTLAAAVQKNTAILERVVAGQESALAKLEGGAATRKPRETAAEKKAREAAEAAASNTAPGGVTQAAEGEAAVSTATVHPLLVGANADVAKNAKNEDEPTAKYRAGDFSRQEVKNEFIGWLGETDNVDERKDRSAFVKAIGAHFGVAQPFHPTDGLADDDQRKQTLFFLRRKREGLKVDFGADYDFDGDPLADQTADADEPEMEDALG